jgi:hypothetical protein
LINYAVKLFYYYLTIFTFSEPKVILFNSTNKNLSIISLVRVMSLQYICKVIDNYYLIFCHDIYNHSLPFDGWFHNCILCEAITANEVNFNYIQNTEIKVLICNNCIKHTKKINNNKIINCINKYILM